MAVVVSGRPTHAFMWLEISESSAALFIANIWRVRGRAGERDEQTLRDLTNYTAPPSPILK